MCCRLFVKNQMLLHFLFLQHNFDGIILLVLLLLLCCIAVTVAAYVVVVVIMLRTLPFCCRQMGGSWLIYFYMVCSSLNTCSSDFLWWLLLARSRLCQRFANFLTLFLPSLVPLLYILLTATTTTKSHTHTILFCEIFNFKLYSIWLNTLYVTNNLLIVEWTHYVKLFKSPKIR